jgi:hypothetical protein
MNDEDHEEEERYSNIESFRKLIANDPIPKEIFREINYRKIFSYI